MPDGRPGMGSRFFFCEGLWGVSEQQISTLRTSSTLRVFFSQIGTKHAIAEKLPKRGIGSFVWLTGVMCVAPQMLL